METEKILIIATNREKLPMPVPPVGAAYIAGSLREHGYTVELLDLCFVKNIEKVTKKYIKTFNPDVIGISIRNLDNSTAFGSKSYIDEVKELITYIKGMVSAEIVVGGSGFTSAPGALLDFFELKYGIVGEGEQAILDFIEYMNHKRDISSVANLAFRQNGKVEINSSDSFADLNNIPAPAYDLINYKKYIRNGGHVSIQTKRGCKFKCIYCSYPMIEGNRYRLRKPDSVVDEIEKLHTDQGIDHFFFVDSVFSFPESHALEICGEIVKRGVKIHWEAMVNPRGISNELVSMMKKSGCIGIEMGIDTASESMLVKLRKGFLREDIAVALKLYKDFEIPVSLYLLIGGPGETKETIDETVQFLDSVSSTNQVLMNFGIRIYAGTELADIAKDEGVVENDERFMKTKVYISKSLGKESFSFLDSYCRTRYHWSNATDWNSPMTAPMMRLTQKLRLRPFWKYSVVLGVVRRLRLLFMN